MTETFELPDEAVLAELTRRANRPENRRLGKAFQEIPMPDGQRAVYKLVAYPPDNFSYVFQYVQ